MRKRKSPIVLVTVLAVMASVAFGFNYATSRAGASPSEAPAAPPVEDAKAVGEARSATDAKSVSSGVKGAMTPSTTPNDDESHGRPPGPGGMASGPTILSPVRPSVKPEKPKPNTSSTSAQWYDKESGMGAKD